MTELIHKTRTSNGFVLQGFRYLLVGGTATLADWTLFTVLIALFSVHYTVATSIALILGTAVNYGLSVKFVFTGRRFSRKVELLLIYTVNFAGLAINLVGMVALVEMLAFSPFVAKGILMIALFAWNYMIRRHLIFGEKSVRLPRPIARLVAPARRLLARDLGNAPTVGLEPEA